MLLGVGSTRGRFNPSETEVSGSLPTGSRLDKCFENQGKAHVKLYDFHSREKPARCQEFLVAMATRTEVHSVDPLAGSQPQPSLECSHLGNQWHKQEERSLR